MKAERRIAIYEAFAIAEAALSALEQINAEWRRAGYPAVAPKTYIAGLRRELERDWDVVFPDAPLNTKTTGNTAGDNNSNNNEKGTIA